MRKQTCNCHPNSPFHWAHNPGPSIFVQDIAFRPKTPQTYAHLSKGENLVAYKAFSIHSRAHPSVKPTLNKHETAGRKK
jgi:hypothetical protein